VAHAKENAMRHADRPSGPGKPLTERRDAVAEQEEIDEMDAGQPDAPQPGSDPAAAARHADRDAHAGSDRDGAGDNAEGGS
jgi:hypothetical protein